MPNEFSYFDPDDDDLEEYRPRPAFRGVAIALLFLIAAFGLFALVSLCL